MIMNKNKTTMNTPKIRFPEFKDDGDWEEKKLGEVCEQKIREIEKPNTLYLALGIRSHAKGVFQKPNSEPDKIAMDKLYIVHENDLVVNITFAWEGAIAVASKNDHGGLVSHRFPTYVCKENCLIDFLKYVVTDKKFITLLELISPGGAGRNRVLSKKDFIKIKISLPTPTEQQRIADCLSSLDDLITAESEKLESLKQHKKGLMQNLFPQAGESVPRLRFPEFKGSGAWEEKKLGEICENTFSGGTPSSGNTEYYGGEIPFIRSAEIARNKTQLFLTDLGYKNSSAKFVKKGDVLVALYGANSGDVAISKIEGAINQAILCLRTKNSNNFIYHFLTHKKEWIIATYIQGGQGNLSGEIVKSILILMPTPTEQQRIAECLSSLDDLITAESEKLESLKQHKKGLMQGLFV
jgi:type I restriction enzyme S subunit